MGIDEPGIVDLNHDWKGTVRRGKLSPEIVARQFGSTMTCGVVARAPNRKLVEVGSLSILFILRRGGENWGQSTVTRTCMIQYFLEAACAEWIMRGRH